MHKPGMPSQDTYIPKVKKFAESQNICGKSALILTYRGRCWRCYANVIMMINTIIMMMMMMMTMQRETVQPYIAARQDLCFGEFKVLYVFANVSASFLRRQIDLLFIDLQ